MPTIQGTDPFTNVVAGNYDAFFNVDGTDPSGVTSPLYQDCTHSLRISPTGSNEGVRKNLTGSPSRGWTGFPYYITTSPSGGQGILRMSAVTAGILANVSISAARAIHAFVGAGSVVNGPTLDIDTWYWIEAIYNVLSNPHVLHWRVNGVDQTPAEVAATGGDSVGYAQLFSSSGGATWYAGGKWSWGSATSDSDWSGEPSPAANAYAIQAPMIIGG